MNKRLIFIILGSVWAIMLASCDRASITGTWIDVSSISPFVDSIGFTLNNDNTVSPINSGYYNYQTWEKVDDMLILKGAYTGGSNPRDFIDTMQIVTLKKDSLILQQGSYTLSYARR